MLRVEFLAQNPPAFWRKARTLDRLVPDWRFDRLSADSGYLSCTLRYDTPNGNTLWALNRSDISRFIQVDEPQLARWGYDAWEFVISAAAQDILSEIGLYIMLCDMAVFGAPLAPFTPTGE